MGNIKTNNLFGDDENTKVEDDLEDFSQDKNTDKIQPFLKWAGGKYKKVDEIKTLFPVNAERYLEPFIGAGSVALNVSYGKIIINDNNTDLINVYKALKVEKLNFISDCKDLFVPENNTREKYGELKEEFNTTKDVYRKSILFIYLNRHCFNGLCRYNGRGEFNTPIGDYKNPYFPEKQMKRVMDKLSNFTFYNEDYSFLLKMAGDKDIVYCDPPYLPISDSSSFNSYSVSGEFSLQDHLELARMSSEASERGAVVVISNHLNWYSKQIYKDMFGAKIKTLKVSRTISGNTENRKAVQEIIAIFSKKGK